MNKIMEQLDSTITEILSRLCNHNVSLKEAKIEIWLAFENYLNKKAEE